MKKVLLHASHPLSRRRPPGGASLPRWPSRSSPPGPSTSASSKPTIIIGSTNFEEQAIVSNIWADVLKKAGYNVTVEPALGTRAIVVPAIEKGQIDLEPDYAASLLGFLHNGGILPAAGDNISTAIPADQKALASYGVTVLPASKALDTNVFAVTKATASKDHLTTISSLKPYASKLTLGGPPECPTFALLRARPEEGLRPHLRRLQVPRRGGPAQRGRPQERRGAGGRAGLERRQRRLEQLRGTDRQQAPRGRRLHRPGHPQVGGHRRRGEGARQHRRQADHRRHLEAEPRRERRSRSSRPRWRRPG